MAYTKKTLSAKKNADGNVQVMIYMQFSRALKMRIKSGVFVPGEYWNAKTECLTIPRKASAKIVCDLRDLNEQIEITENRITKLVELYGDVANKDFVENAITLLKSYDGKITKEVVDKYIKASESDETETKPKSFFEYAKLFLESYKIGEGRKKFYKVIFRTMARYQLFANAIHKNNFVWSLEATKEDMEDFYDYIVEENVYRTKMPKVFADTDKIYDEGKDTKHKNEVIQARGANRIVSMKKGVGAFWHWLIKEGYTTNNPLLNLSSGSESYGTPYYLTIEERDKIADHDLSENPSLATQRDIFVFHCLVGCRVGDLVKLTKDNIVNDMLVYEPHKTKDHTSSFVVRVPLNDKALELIERYQGADTRGRLFPFISTQNYCDAIKEILKICKIERKVSVRNSVNGENEMKPLCDIASSHLARRTFVGNIYKVVQDPNLIGRMSGHVEGSRAFARYRDIDDDMLRSVISATNKKVQDTKKDEQETNETN